MHEHNKLNLMRVNQLFQVIPKKFKCEVLHWKKLRILASRYDNWLTVPDTEILMVLPYHQSKFI